MFGKPGAFGASLSNTGSGFSFGNNSATSNNNTGSGFSFGNNNNTSSNTNTAGSGFSFGNKPATTTGGGLFGNNNSSSTGGSSGLFGNNASSNTNASGGGLFGNNSNANANTSGGLFGNNNNNTNTTGSGGLFGNNNNNASTNTSGGLFGNSSNTSTGGGLFGNNANTNNAGTTGSSGFSLGKPATTTTTTGTAGAGGGLFGNKTSTASTGTSLFGGGSNTTASTGSSLFSGNSNTTGATTTGSSLFGKPATSTTGSLFGNTTNNANNAGAATTTGGLFGSKPATTNTGSLFGNASKPAAPFTAGAQPSFPFSQKPRLANPTINALQLQQQEQQQQQNINNFSNTILEQLLKIKTLWDPLNPQLKLTAYFYNKVPENEVLAYTKPDSVSQEEWNAALAKRPNNTYIPVKAAGFEDLQKRSNAQTNHVAHTRLILQEIEKKTKELADKHDLDLTTRIVNCKSRHEKLSKKLLILGCKLALLKSKGFPLTPDEEILGESFAKLLATLHDPSGLGRRDEMWSRLAVLRERSEIIKGKLETVGGRGGEDDEAYLQKVTKVLQKQQLGIQYLTEVLERDSEVLDRLEKK